MRPGRLLLVLCLPVLGCQSTLPRYVDQGHPRQVRDFIVERKAAAARFESEGAWRDALREWQIIDAVSPGDDTVDHEVQRLKSEVQRRFLRLREAARQASDKGRLREARERWIGALALRPDDQDAIDALKAIEARLAYAAMPAEPEIARGSQSEIDVYTAQRQKPKRSAGSVATRNPSAGRSAPAASAATNRRQQASELVSKGRYEAALKALLSLRESEGGDPQLDSQIAEVRRVLAERHYARGVAAFRDARYDEAVNEFALTLRYEPDNHKARFYHSSAEALSRP